MADEKMHGYMIQQMDNGTWSLMIGHPPNGWYVTGFSSEEAVGGWLLEFLERNHITMARLAGEAAERAERVKIAREEMLSRLLEPATKQ